MTGLDRLLSRSHFPHPGAKAGFLGHAASRAADGRHAMDHLLERREWTLVRLFGPEHGFDAIHGPGEKVSSGHHPVWKLPVISLYGDHRAPTPGDLAGLDLLVIDLQDLGVRCYTYASTLDLTLQACAKADLPVLVLDRPVPLAGIVDGPNLDPAFQSFVAQVPLPLVFGLGQAGLARHLQSIRPELSDLHLDVIHCDQNPADFMPAPSPAIVSLASARIYPLTVWCEALGGVTVERGGDRSFQVWGMEGFPAGKFCAEVAMPGARSIPTTCTLPDGGAVPGVEWRITDLSLWRPVTMAVHLLAFLRDHAGADLLFDSPGSRPDFFDRLMGTDSVRKKLQQGASAEDIVSTFAS